MGENGAVREHQTLDNLFSSPRPSRYQFILQIGRNRGVGSSRNCPVVVVVSHSGGRSTTE